MVMSENSTNEPSRLIAASTGLAIPKDKTRYGYISEHHSYGQKEALAGEYAEDLAAYMLATTLNAPFDPDKSYDEQKDHMGDKRAQGKKQKRNADRRWG